MTADHPEQPRRELPTTLAFHNLVFIDEDDDWDDEDFDADHSGCAFCLGREAAHRGEGEDPARVGQSESNPCVCGYLRAGHSRAAATRQVLANDPTFTPWHASAMVNASTTGLLLGVRPERRMIVPDANA